MEIATDVTVISIVHSTDRITRQQDARRARHGTAHRQWADPRRSAGRRPGARPQRTREMDRADATRESPQSTHQSTQVPAITSQTADPADRRETCARGPPSSTKKGRFKTRVAMSFIEETVARRE